MTPEIYLIHDPQRHDRRELYRRELETQGIETVTIVPAVKDTNVGVIKNIARAHKQCIRKAMERDLERVVVLEDDVKFVCPGAYNRFLELSETLDESWDLFTTGSYGFEPESGSDPVVKVKWFSALHCYMVSKRYYQRFLDTPEENNLDRGLTGAIYMTHPMLALQWDTWSDNVSMNTSYNVTHMEKVLIWNCQ